MASAESETSSSTEAVGPSRVMSGPAMVAPPLARSIIPVSPRGL